MGSEGFDAACDVAAAELQAGLVPASMVGVEFLRTHVAEQTPIETGRLVGSEDVQPDIDGAQLLIPGPYARNQHYNMTFHHNTGNALYLELPWMQYGQEALNLIGRELGFNSE